MKKIIGQQMIIGIQGTQLLEEERKFIIENNIGGLILFDRNIESPQQLHELNCQIHDLSKDMRDKAPLFLSVDMEGGRVQRLKEPFTIWPPLKHLGDHNSSSLAFRFSLSMGEELKAFGFNLDYAPCIDILLNKKNEVIGDRAISSDPEIVTTIASALVRGYVKSNVIPCAKHFPGHGSVEVDSHFDLPISDYGVQELDASKELEPFKKVFRSRCELLMTAHIKYPNIDPDWPVTLSPLFLQQILRQALRYRGLIMTDDLDMKALTKHYPKTEIPIQALRAGANVLLYCNDFESPVKALDNVEAAIKSGSLDSKIVEDNHSAVLKFKKKHIAAPYGPFDYEKAMEIISRKDHKAFAKDLEVGNVEPYLS